VLLSFIAYLIAITSLIVSLGVGFKFLAVAFQHFVLGRKL
jgi:hypothetical protein